MRGNHLRLTFLPAWIGDAVCALLVILSWFASCPYIQLCLEDCSLAYDYGPSGTLKLRPSAKLPTIHVGR